MTSFVRASLLALACAPALASDAPSPRNASYTIDVRLDAGERTLTGRQVVEWRNIQGSPTDELWFHLYWNAWRNDLSSWMIEDRLARRSEYHRADRHPEPEDWSWIEVDAVLLLEDPPGEPRALERRFVSPDDANPDDRTVMVVTLPDAVLPGETVRLELTWRSRIPRTFARTGYRGDAYFIAQWFPKLGVYESDGWSCHQFHAFTEFYSDFGVYDVRLTVPDHYVVGATGRETERASNEDGSVTVRYRQEDVHDFAWTASPSYRVLEERFEADGLPPVDIRLLLQPEHAAQADRHFAAARVALESFGRWYGPYPYGHVTLVDPAWESGAAGMEYPTLITAGTRRFIARGEDDPENVVVHEMGHQFWYGLVANDEFEHAWLDEGLTTFSTNRALEAAYEPPVLVARYLGGFVPVRFAGIELSRWERRRVRYGPIATADPPSRPTYRYYPSTAASITYDKTTLWLATLERHLGWETLRAILATFFERHRFRHPTPDDFLAVAAEVSGQELDWFFDQVYRDSVAFDYAIVRADSRRVKLRGWGEPDERGLPRPLDPAAVENDVVTDGSSDDESDDSDDEVEKSYRTEVVVRRLGDGRFPVDVALVFEDGHEIRERWDGRERWEMYVVERPSKLRYAEVDPDRVLMLDVDLTNNALMRKPKGRLPAVKWASKWMIWFQERLSAFAFFM